MKRKTLAAIWIMIGTMLVVARAAEVLKGTSEPKSPTAATASVNPMQCDLTGYKEAMGLKAEVVGDALRVTWVGAGGQELRGSFGLLDAAPIIREMAIRRQGGQWGVLGRDLSPEFHITAGKRRISEQQLAPLRALGLDRDPEFIDRENSKASCDPPLVIPGSSRSHPHLPPRP